jgi:hypothetical protein
MVCLLSLALSDAQAFVRPSTEPESHRHSPMDISAGFSSQANELSPNLMKAWDSTFLFTFSAFDRLGTATAFIVDIKKAPTGYDVYFLTNYHVFENDCSPHGRCFSAAVRRGIGWNSIKRDFIGQSQDVVLMDYIEVMKVSRNPDLALLKARLGGEESKGKTPTELRLRPLPIRAQCRQMNGERIWIIGFPSTYLRDKPESMIAQPKLTYKRWSSGLALDVRLTASRYGETQNFLMTTADSLGGNSGGPVLDQLGRVVGVHSIGVANQASGHAYEGNETPGAERFHSGAVPCFVIQEFLKGAL